MFVIDELSFDRYHKNADNIYRVSTQFGLAEMKNAFTPPPLAQAMLDDFPEVEYAARLSLWPRERLVCYKEKSFLEKGIIFADSSIFNVFSLNVRQGNPDKSLVKPFTIAITESIAKKYFGDEDPIGKHLIIGSYKGNYEITAIIEDCPRNSHFQYDIIASIITTATAWETSWGGSCYYTYIVLQPDIPPSQLEEKFPDFIQKHLDPELYEELTKNGTSYYGFFLQPLQEIHLSSDIFDSLSKKGNRTYVYVFSCIALFVFLIACINYINLSTALYTKRSKEVGLRKTIGSSRKQIIQQFITESIVISFISVCFAIVIVELIIPLFNNFTGKDLSFNLFVDYSIIPLLLGFIFLSGILSGSYPAFFISSIKPIEILKGRLIRKNRLGLTLRHTLVIFQFAISILIIICTVMIYNQLRFVQNSELGFDKDNILVIHRGYSLGDNYENFRQELLQYPEILNISNSESMPGRHFDPNSHQMEGTQVSEKTTLFTTYGDYNFAELFGLEILQGRYFSSDFDHEENSVIINETAAQKLGLENPIGTKFYKRFGNAKEGEFVTVVGVVKDVNFTSLHTAIEPMIIRYLSDNQSYVRYTSLKIRSEHVQETLSLIETKWKKFTGDQPFEYTFLDDDLNALYLNDAKTGQTIALFSALSIFIACLGLFGLASYASEQRIKEIGVRKVLGASVRQIVVLLSSDFLKWVLFANLIAWPVAWYAMNKWLQNFAYRTNIGVGVFLFSGLIAILIAFLTVSFRTIKAANANPVKSLKYE
jgi:putative ABC transport system permease protein